MSLGLLRLSPPDARAGAAALEGAVGALGITAGGVDLDGGVHRQGRHADGGAGVAALVAENLDEEVRGTVGDLVLLGEGRIAGDEDGDLQQAADLRQVTAERQ